MYINKLERREAKRNFNGLPDIDGEFDTVQIEIEVPLHSIQVKDFYEFMKKYPKTEANPYSNDDMPTHMGDCISDYLKTLVDEGSLKSFFGGDFMSTDSLSLHPWTFHLKESKFNFEAKYKVESEAPF